MLVIKAAIAIAGASIPAKNEVPMMGNKWCITRQCFRLAGSGAGTQAKMSIWPPMARSTATLPSMPYVIPSMICRGGIR